MTNVAEQTLATIVARNHQTVPVLEKYSLDFCCKGKRTLSEACIEKGIPVDAVLDELTRALTTETKPTMPFTEMNAEQLISYILIHHHFYVRQSMPSIFARLEKISMKHGENFPNMVKVKGLFAEIKNELEMHLQKEEMILFPRIKEIQEARKKNWSLPQAQYIESPIAVMEHEHDHAGEIMYAIRELTNNYAPVEGACTTFNLTIAELKEFEEDLHRHVHLENNILFPLAEKMIK